MTEKDYYDNILKEGNLSYQTRVLLSPFDVKTHNKTFIHYCEVVILPDGTIEYANPSHIEKLFEVYARNHEITVEQAKQKFVADFDFFDNLMKDTAVMLVWYEYEKHLVIPTKEQRESLQLLIDNNCVSKDIQTYV